ncbi:MAG: hypothetical protein ACI8YQ_001728 [Polaribacter sp.]|jgi:hypothetical protein
MKKFEKHLHDHFDGREINVDKNELWANIAPQLEPAKKDRKKSWFFFFLGLTAGAALLGLYLFTQVEEKPVATAKPTATATASITTISSTEVANANLNTVSTANTNSLSNTNVTATKSAKLSSIANTQTTNNTNPPNTEKHNTDSTNAVTTKEVNEAIFQTSINNTNTNERKTDLFTKTLQKEETRVPLENDLLPISNLPINQFANPGIDLDKLPLILEKQEKGLITPTPSKSNVRVGLGFHAGVSKTQTMLRERSQTEFLYTQLRASTEDQLQTLHLGLSAVVEIKRNIYLQAGLEYSRIDSKLNLDDELILIDTAQYIIIRHGNFIDTIGAGDRYIVKEFSENNSRNSFYLLDLPILFGYQFGKARWKAGIEAGACINLRLRKEGQVLQQDLSIYDIEQDQNKWYKTNVGIRPHLGLVSTYDLSSHYQLYFSTGITFNKIFSTNSSPIAVENSMFGMRVGGRYYF